MINDRPIRLGWDEFWMRQAYLYASRSTCDRKHVGCVLVRDNRIVSAGYNGSMPGAPHCDDVGHLYLDGRSGCQRTSHAEANAIAQAAQTGHRVSGCTAYVTLMPCLSCLKLLYMAGVRAVFYAEEYRENIAPDVLSDFTDMSVRQLSPSSRAHAETVRDQCCLLSDVSWLVMTVARVNPHAGQPVGVHETLGVKTRALNMLRGQDANVRVGPHVPSHLRHLVTREEHDNCVATLFLHPVSTFYGYGPPLDVNAPNNGQVDKIERELGLDFSLLHVTSDILICIRTV